MKKKYYIVFFFISFFLHAQTQRDEKLLSDAKNLIYNNPEKTVLKTKEIIRNSKDEDIKVSARIIMINAQMVMGQAKNVIENCNTALTIARQKNDSVNEILLLAMLGNQYQSMMMNDEAKKYLDLAENKMNLVSLPKNLLYIKGNVYNIKGIVFQAELNCDFALKYFNKAINVYKNLPQNDMTEANQLLVEIQRGFCLLSTGDADRAEKSFLKVIRNDGKVDLGFNRYFAQIGLSEILRERTDYKEALKLLDALPISTVENHDPELTNMYYLAKSNNYLGIGDMQNYIFYYKKYKVEAQKMNKIQDGVIDQTVKDFKQQTKKKAAEIKLQNLVILVILLLFLTVISFFLLKKNFFIKNRSIS